MVSGPSPMPMERIWRTPAVTGAFEQRVAVLVVARAVEMGVGVDHELIAAT